MRSNTTERSSRDCNAICLQRALRKKVTHIRSLLSAKKATVEFDHIVCRLMQIGLASNHQMPDFSRYLRCVLYDLLSLSLKAIERHRKCFIDNYPLHSEGYDTDRSVAEISDVSKFKEDSTADKLLDKYDHLLHGSKDNFTKDDEYLYPDLVLDESSNNSHVSRSCEDILKDYSLSLLDARFSSTEFPQHLNELRRGIISQQDIEVKVKDATNYTFPNTKYVDGMKRKVQRQFRPSTDKSSLKAIKKRKRKALRKVTRKQTHDKVENFEKEIITRENCNNVPSMLLNSIHDTCTIIVNESNDEEFNMMSKRIWVNTEKRQPTIAKPIPDGLIELCKMSEKYTTDFNIVNKKNSIDNEIAFPSSTEMATTEESFLVNIIMEDLEETIALRRTIGTDIDNVLIQSLDESFSNENIEFIADDQTIFLYDINEPSTSKGIRHTNLDVQCGSDTAINNSLINMYPFEKNKSGVLGDFEIKRNNSDFGTCTNDDNITFITPNVTGKGIVIKDSMSIITNRSIKENNTNATLIDSISNSNILKCPPVTNHSVDLSANGYLFTCDKKSNVDCSVYVNKKEYKSSEVSSKVFTDVDSHSSDLAPISLNSDRVNPDTTLLKPSPIPVKMEEIVPGFCDGVGSISKNAIKKENSLNISKNTSTCSNRAKPNLTCGMVQMHSFRERKGMEDVVYQGRWQPRQLKKKPLPVMNKIYSVTNKSKTLTEKQKVLPKENALYTKPLHTFELAKPEQAKNTQKFNCTGLHLLDSNISKNKLQIPRSLARSNKSSHKLTKISSSTKPSKVTVNKWSKTQSTVQSDKINKPTIKTKIGVKTTLNKMNTNKDENHINQLDIKVAGHKHDDIDKSSMKYLKNEILKPLKEGYQHNVKYIVLRNEPDLRDCDLSKLKCSTGFIIKENKSKENVHSSLSASSGCSTPNSVATVRPAFARSYSLVATESLSQECTLSSPVRSKAHNCINNPKMYKIENKENICNITNEILPSRSRCNFTVYNNNICTAKVTDHNTCIGTKSKHFTVKSTCIGRNEQSSCEIEKNNSVKHFVPSVQSPVPRVTSINNTIDLDEKNDYQLNLDKKDERSHTRLGMPDKPFIKDNLLYMPFQDLQFINEIILSIIDSAIHDFPNKEDNSSSNIETKNSCSNRSITSTLAKNVPFVDNFINNRNNKVIDGDVLTSKKVSFSRNSQNSKTIRGLSNSSIISQNKVSEHLIANTDLTHPTTNNLLYNTPNPSSVEGILERKDELTVENVPLGISGLLIVQTFSGFSMSSQSFAGNRQDYVNLMDSETGSLAVDVSRQTASEELHVSERSSESYHSGNLDEDAPVPNWLFQIISEQEEEDEESLPLGSPVVSNAAPVYDANGNVLENAVAAGAGAGDGRGVHSDYSHDSSGRGTSVSSSNTNVSSGPLSDAITIDPSSFTGHYDLIRDGNDRSSVHTNSEEIAPTTSHAPGGNQDQYDENATNSRVGDDTVDWNSISDVKADTSSIDISDS